MMFEALWNYRIHSQQFRKVSLETEIRKIDKKIEQLLDLIIEAESSSVIKTYKNRIQSLEKNKIEYEEKNNVLRQKGQGI